ncbi:MAG: response regulator transcription factor [Pseudorhodobacter sp.]|nr:response regulator transcription factor [Pseudorhodobacter sp.]
MSKHVGIRRTALIADGDEFFRLALASVLCDRLHFSEVVQTETFDAAADALSRRDDVELALFDLDLRDPKSWQNLRALRERFPSLRVAVVSCSQDRNDILKALSIGLHGYVSKGLGVSELTRALQSICAGIIYLPPFLPDLPIEDAAAAALPDAGATPDRVAGSIADFTPRQSEVLDMLVRGRSNKAMARELNLSEGTIKFHLSAVFRVLHATNRVEAATCGARLLDHRHAMS